MKKSPFPGMDPYLERHWGDVHHSLIQYTRDALQPQLPEDLRARVEERVFLEATSSEKRLVIPDVSVTQPLGFEPPVQGWQPELASSAAEGGVAVAEPLVFHSVEITEGFLEIRERSGGKLVTAIEFLSPSNKLTGPGREKYLEKQREVLRSDASLVEIDLVRRGERVVVLPPGGVPEVAAAAYVASICPGWDPGTIEVYPISLRERLPVLPMPLRKGERRVRLDLQLLFERIYESGRYDDTDYSQAPEPPLSGEDAGWMKSLVG